MSESLEAMRERIRQRVQARRNDPLVRELERIYVRGYQASGEELEFLPPHLAVVLRRRAGLRETLAAIGRDLGVSGSAVRERELAALARLSFRAEQARRSRPCPHCGGTGLAGPAG
jgi:hypothetical protein